MHSIATDEERCYRAVLSRDARFDGWFVTAVRTTHIYCRPSCPAITPRRENVRFYPTAAAAQQVGYRACKRCRPDAAPGSPEWNARGDLVGRRIHELEVWENEADRAAYVGRLAEEGRVLNHRVRLRRWGVPVAQVFHRPHIGSISKVPRRAGRGSIPGRTYRTQRPLT